VDPVRQMRRGHPCDPRSVRVTWRVRVDWPYASP
jgi:hypothetical protein